MADIIITINAKNLTGREVQKLQRDLTTLRQGFNDASGASKGLGDQARTAYKQVERVSGVVNSISTVTAGFGGVKAAIGALGTAATGPIGLAIGATAALTAGVLALANAQEKAREESQRMAREYRNTVNAIKRDPSLSTGRKALEQDILSAGFDVTSLRKRYQAAKKERQKFRDTREGEGAAALRKEIKLEAELADARERYKALQERRKRTDEELNATRKASLQTQLKTIDAQLKENQLLRERYILQEKQRKISPYKAFEITSGLSSGTRNLETQRTKIIQELKALQREEQQIIGETTSLIETQNTALQEQVLILEARVAALEALQQQKTIVAEQTTALQEQNKITETQTTTLKDQVYQLETVVVVAHKLNKELRDQVDLQKLITEEVERRKTAESVQFPAEFSRPVEGVQFRFDRGDVSPQRNNRQLSAERPEQPFAPRRTTSIFSRGISRPTQDIGGLDNLNIATKPNPSARARPIQVPDYERAQQAIIDTISNVPVDLLSATYDSLVKIPQQMEMALDTLQENTQTRIQEIKESEILSARQKASQIEQIEKDAAQRRTQIEKQANQAKIDSFQSVVTNFIGGIGRMIAEQVKLRAATAVTNALLGAPGQSGGGSGIGGILGSALPFLAAVNPALAIGGGLALGAAALFSSSFDDPINDALAQQAGIRQAQQRATALGRRSAVDLKDNFEQGFVSETARQTASPRGEGDAPVIMNEIKLVIGAQELKAMYEETQRQITTGIIAR
ncbi:hypothetical protein C6496_13870 [Candidatus Poribacteria bacterium]|nr:MAG: hypothetical protein C6496_13870 [Candidatus Poribacteria bacterium]